MRVVVVGLAVALLAAGCTGGGEVSGVPGKPSELVGIWALDAEPGALLEIGAGSVNLYRADDIIVGSWISGRDGRLRIDMYSCDEACSNEDLSYAQPWAWETAAFLTDGATRVLVDEAGERVVILRPAPAGAVPAMWEQHRAGRVRDGESSELTPRQLAAVDRFPLPPRISPGLSAVSEDFLVGHWRPVAGSADPFGEPVAAGVENAAELLLAPRGYWFGGDCNAFSGRWMADGTGWFAAHYSFSTDQGCDAPDLRGWMDEVAGAAADGDVLVLLDRRGRELGRLDRQAPPPDWSRFPWAGPPSPG